MKTAKSAQTDIYYLREAMRDKTKFPLVYAENVSFGFRRNLWGMKPGGIAVATIALVAAASHAAKQYLDTQTLQGLDAACILLCAGMFALWLARFTKSWVRLAADEYATRLLAAFEVLVREKDAKP